LGGTGTTASITEQIIANLQDDEGLGGAP